MKKMKWNITNGKKGIKYVLFELICCMMLGTIFGCGFVKKDNSLAKEIDSDHIYAEELFQSIIDALEQKDEEALKKLFSPYALENSNDLDLKIKELMEFYPGYNGEYKVSIYTEETSAYSGKEYILCPQYTIINDGYKYKMRLITYIQNEEESDKIGVYSIQVMTDEAMPEGFKWREEDSVPGIFN